MQAFHIRAGPLEQIPQGYGGTPAFNIRGKNFTKRFISILTSFRIVILIWNDTTEEVKWVPANFINGSEKLHLLTIPLYSL